MFFHQRFIPGLAIASYVVGDEKTKQAAVIDPTRDVQLFLDIAEAEGLRITHVMETHVHADFVSGAAELKARLGDAVQVHSSGMGGKEWTPPYADHVVSDGDEVSVGSIRLRAMHTPGHTFEHMTWALFDETRSKETPWLLFTGDFLFVGDVGRPDLLGEGPRKLLAKQLYESVFERLSGLPDFTEIFPNHGAGSLCGKAIGSRRSSTLGYERRFNGSMRRLPEAQWVASLLEGMPPAPPYFLKMKQMNSAGPAILGGELPGRRGLSAAEVRALSEEEAVVLDVRSKEAFAAAHVPGSINIPRALDLPTWAGWVMPYDKPIVIVPSSESEIPAVLTDLVRIGLDRVAGYLSGGIESWEGSGHPLSRVETLSAVELSDRLRRNGTMVLDLRTDAEWAAGHIAGAKHVHAGLLQERLDEIPRDRPLATLCGSGFRASMTASILKRNGYGEVANVMGGMSAWKAAGLPLVR